MRFWTRRRSEKRSDPAECRRGSGPTRRRTAARPRLEMLEERRVLSTLIVNSSSDGDNWGSLTTLRGEIQAAQPGDTIGFAPSLQGQTITLSGGELEINKNLTIQGLGATLLAINGDSNNYLATANMSRVFRVDAGAIVTIGGLTIEGGNGTAYTSSPSNGTGPTGDYYDGLGGGVLNLGTLTLSGCAVTNNLVDVGSQSRFEGGGIYNNGTLTLSGSIVTGNTAKDNYLTSTYVVKGAGGGIFNDTRGNLTILSSVVTNNTASDGADICNLGTITVSKDSTIGKVSRK